MRPVTVLTFIISVEYSIGFPSDDVPISRECLKEEERCGLDSPSCCYGLECSGDRGAGGLGPLKTVCQSCLEQPCRTNGEFCNNNGCGFCCDGLKCVTVPGTFGEVYDCRAVPR